MAAGIRKAVRFEIYRDDSTGRLRLSETCRDSSLAASAIEDRRVRAKMREKKVGVDLCAAGLDRGLEMAVALRCLHCNLTVTRSLEFNRRPLHPSKRHLP